MQFGRRERCNKSYLVLLNLQYRESGTDGNTCCWADAAAGDSGRNVLAATMAYTSAERCSGIVDRFKAGDMKRIIFANLSRQITANNVKLLRCTPRRNVATHDRRIIPLLTRHIRSCGVCLSVGHVRMLYRNE